MLQALFARSFAPLLLAVCVSTAAISASGDAAMTASGALAATGRTARVESGVKFFGDAQYVGSDSCEVCHERQHAQWAGTWHAKMQRSPRAEIIVGDFDNRTIVLKNLKVKNQAGQEETISASALAFRQGATFYFTLIDADRAANNQTYEIGRVIGGKWDQGYEVRFGNNFMAAPLRWSVARKDWLIGGFNPEDWFVADGTADGRPLRPDEIPMNRAAETKCNGCHTTGSRFANAKDTWISANEGELGIGCESCHGPASRHIREAEQALDEGKRLIPGKTAIVNPLRDLNPEQATQICGQCHGRGTHKDQPELAFPTGFLPGNADLGSHFRFWGSAAGADSRESAYFWPNGWAMRNRQQTQDFTKSAHYTKAGMSCLTCHALHGASEGAQLRQTRVEICTDCHRKDGAAKTPNAEMFEGSDMQEAGVTCVDCHMARIGSRSQATSKSGHQWDTSSHVFAAATPAQEKELGVRHACATCHSDPPVTMPSGAKAKTYTTDMLIKRLEFRANEVQTGIDDVKAKLAAVDRRKPGASALVDEATTKIDFLRMDNSKGMHNYDRAKELIEEAKVLATKAARLGPR